MSDSDDDTDLFRAAVGKVRRVRSDRDHSRPEPRRRGRARESATRPG